MALILIADDVTVARELLARGLRDAGHRVLLVADGNEALERFERDRPDAVVLDILMPGLSGIEACSRMKAIDPGYTPVLFVSARAEKDMKMQALAVGDDIIAKPYDVDELNARIEAHLRPRRIIDELRRGGGTVQPTPSIDAATGLRGKPFFLERVGQEWRRSTRMNEPLSLFMVSADGDSALSQVGAALQRVLRQIDTVCRFDVDRLAALLPNTHVSGALLSAERLKRELGALAVPVPASLGIACYPGREVTSPDDLVRLAARALDRAREEGAGHICLYQHQGYIFRPQI